MLQFKKEVNQEHQSIIFESTCSQINRLHLYLQSRQIFDGRNKNSYSYCEFMGISTLTLLTLLYIFVMPNILSSCETSSQSHCWTLFSFPLKEEAFVEILCIQRDMSGDSLFITVDCCKCKQTVVACMFYTAIQIDEVQLHHTTVSLHTYQWQV